MSATENTTNHGSKIAAALAAIRAKREAAEAQAAIESKKGQMELKHIPLAPVPAIPVHAKNEHDAIAGGQFQGNITLNDKQLYAARLAKSGRCFCLVGPAGSGKTTALLEVVKQAMQLYEADEILPCSFTNRAVRNISRAIATLPQKDGLITCSTIHKALGYAPQYFDYIREDGTPAKTMRFMPTFTALNPLSTKLIIIDESSMVDVRLFNELYDATPEAIFIFVGDLNQLVPVFGEPILGFALNQLPVVELTEVYRQALENPILWFVHNFILKGKLPGDSMLEKLNTQYSDKGLTFHPFKNDKIRGMDGEQLAQAVAQFMIKKLESGEYEIGKDAILIPYNKSFGATEINLNIAEHLAKTHCMEVFEIIAGFEKKYLAVDDFIMFQKKECRITSIRHNPRYLGSSPQTASTELNRFGFYRGNATGGINLDLPDESTFAELLKTGTSGTYLAGDDERVNAASHIITMEDLDSGNSMIASTAAEVNGIDFGYAMTIHKAQGSQWRKVWLVATQGATVSGASVYRDYKSSGGVYHTLYSSNCPGKVR